jgi:PhnB protein
MHVELAIGDTKVLASDGECRGQQNFQGFGLSLATATPAEAERHFNALGEGGRVIVPLAQTPFAARFGMVADRFGVTWLVVTQ